MRAVSTQFRQLPMFMTADEVGEIPSNDLRGAPVKEWDHRVESTFSPSTLYDPDGTYRGSRNRRTYLDSMAAKVAEQGGIENPIHVWNGPHGPLLFNGHHRVQVAKETGRLIPVLHHAGSYVEAGAAAIYGPESDIEPNGRV